MVSSTVSKEVVGRDSNDENEDTEEYTPYNGPGVDTIIMLTSILLREKYERARRTYLVASKANMGELFGSMEDVMSRKRIYRGEGAHEIPPSFVRSPVYTK